MIEEFGRCRWVQLGRGGYFQCINEAFSRGGLCQKHHRDWQERERYRAIEETGIDPWEEPEEETKPLGFDVRGMGFGGSDEGPQENPWSYRLNPNEKDPVDADEFPAHLFRELLFCRLQTRKISDKIRRYYVVQYDVFWSLTPLQWAEVIINAMTNPNGYNLDKYKALRNKPVNVYRSGDSYDTFREGLAVMSPLDWKMPQWLYEAEQLGLLDENEFSSADY